MKIVQIGAAGHAFYAYNGIKAHDIDFSGISSGSAGIEAEGISQALERLKKLGFSPKLYSDWREMLDAEKPDIAIVDCWFNEHGKISLWALERGINVFVDKPIATDFETLDAISKCGGAFIGAMFDYRCNPTFKAAKKAIEQGRIGEVRMMVSRKSYKLGKRPEFYRSRETYCGIIPWVAIHAIDWMAWLSGEKYTDVSAMLSRRENGGNGDMDIAAAAQFTMTNDVIATVTADMYRPSSAKTHGDDRVRVVGTKGIIEVMSGKATLISDEAGGLIELPDEPAGDIFEDFLDNLAGKSNHLTKESAVSSTYWALRADRQALSRLG